MPAAFRHALEAAIQGEVRFDEGSRAVYAADASNYRQVPICVVLPRSAEDIEAALSVCRQYDVPVLARGGGTSMNGQAVNVAVVIDTSKYMNRVRNIDPVAHVADVEPGVVCDALRDAAEEYGLTFGPDPATHSRCTLGGMIGNNSCGAHSIMAGKTVENIESLEILTYDGARFRVGPTTDDELQAIIAAGGRRGEIYAALRDLRDRHADAIRSGFPHINRRVSGYNLDQLLPENGFNVARALVGTEGGCAITLEARTRLVHSPRERAVLVLGFPDIYLAGDAVPRILPFNPIATEGLDIAIIGGLKRRGLRLEDIARLPAGDAWIMVEFGADTRAEAQAQAQALVDSWAGESAAPSHWLIDDPVWAERIWTIREVGASATSLQDQPGLPDPVVGWEDAAVDPLRLGDYLREFQRLIDRYGYQTSLFGHFGDGCIHARITFDLRSVEGIRTWRAFLREAAELVVRYGGSLTGEHGDGQAKAEFLPIMYGPELMQAFREFKAIWDPLHRMNPHKLIDPYRADEHLRQGPEYRPIRFDTRFAFPKDGNGQFGNFSRAVERCVGMGKCRSQDGGTMCPSYRATGEEKYSTRGRARLFAEMLRGDVVRDGWNSEAVKEALDLCLACKGCKSDCPTHVDMASYKAEFLSHYYERQRRPVQAWSMGRIGQWAPLAAVFPRLVNLVTQKEPLASIARAIGGIARGRSLPPLALRTFRSTFVARPAGARRVILWVDTFSNHFQPEVAQAALRVLEHAGCTVVLPKKRLCCGRPLYDFGLLDQARSQLAEILDVLGPEIDAGTPVVGLEPSCTSVFRDELLNLFPDDARARKLAAQTLMFADYLQQIGYRPAPAGGTALVQGHCHQKAVLGMSADAAMLAAAGVQWSSPESGCCGMAGSFGFHPDTAATAQQIGERALLPAVRASDGATRLVANGFSCREQIRLGSAREAVHIAQVLDEAIRKEFRDN
ncbi:FAD-binding and (Fe-S)-binding domain-containing protein [Lacisediminimonas sp.]|uniref:FAD-binding and (Fe-S)-binding domain-containing protein n=1 Tax=Lacisediminimonas sp. TaxID=3060582 RepID=UPI00272160D7|nr:FAD-binding and (Fe-S)-binding domain-containing protein [Lacisediminimonas sp.]MDO8301346.1 FAD-binding and (Fe-S)-binding domain-containing protein [Lacisediminimonas sp.]